MATTETWFNTPSQVLLLLELELLLVQRLICGGESEMVLGIFNCMFLPPNNEFFMLCLQINLSGTISGPLTDQKLQIIIIHSLVS